VGNEDLRVDKPIRLSTFFSPVSLTGCPRACNDFGTHRPSLRFIAIEKPLRRLASNHAREFPGEVIGILDPSIHSLPTCWWMDMGGVASNENASDPIGFRQTHANPKNR